MDETQECPEAIMSLRFFKENMPRLHVIAAGSLLEFALAELPTFGVGRIHSMFMYPMTFDEFLLANEEDLLFETRNAASSQSPLPEPLHEKKPNTNFFLLKYRLPPKSFSIIRTLIPKFLKVKYGLTPKF